MRFDAAAVYNVDENGFFHSKFGVYSILVHGIVRVGDLCRVWLTFLIGRSSMNSSMLSGSAGRRNWPLGLFLSEQILARRQLTAMPGNHHVRYQTRQVG